MSDTKGWTGPIREGDVVYLADMTAGTVLAVDGAEILTDGYPRVAGCAWRSVVADAVGGVATGGDLVYETTLREMAVRIDRVGTICRAKLANSLTARGEHLEALRTAFPCMKWERRGERSFDGGEGRSVVRLRSAYDQGRLWWGGSVGAINVGYLEAGGPVAVVRALLAECIRLGDWARGCE